MGAKSAVKMQKWGRKAPPKQQSDGKKCHTQIREKKDMVAESAIKMENGGGKCNQNSKVTAKSATISVIVVVH